LGGAGYSNIFIAKMDSSSNWKWAQQAYCTNDLENISISVDGSGNSFVAGFFQGTAQFGTTSLNNNHGAAFIAKMNTNGEWLWAKQASATYEIAALSVTNDNHNNAYITGCFKGTADFGTISLTNAGSNDVFIAKIDADGNWLWVKQAGGTEDDVAFDVAVDIENSVYITGGFKGMTFFGSTSLTVNGTFGNTFIAKLNTDGTWLWAKKVDGTRTNYGNAIAINDQDDVYLSGTYNLNATFGTTTLSESDSSNIYLAKMNKDGNWLWAKKTDNAIHSHNSAIVVDRQGNAYLSSNTLITTTVTTPSSTTTYSVSGFFLAKADPNGNWLWSEKASEGYPAGSTPSSIAVDALDYAYVTGGFQGTVAFGSTTLTSAGQYDIFIAKIK